MMSQDRVNLREGHNLNMVEAVRELFMWVYCLLKAEDLLPKVPTRLVV